MVDERYLFVKMCLQVRPGSEEAFAHFARGGEHESRRKIGALGDADERFFIDRLFFG